MKEYSNYIKGLAKRRSTETFYNSSKEHAAEVMSTLFFNATEEMCLNSGNLNGDICGTESYLQGFEDFVTRGGKLKVLVKEYDPKNEPKIYTLFRFYKNAGCDINVKQRTKEVVDTDGNIVHFALGDKDMFRLEHDIKKYLAFGSFNDKLFVDHLKSHFNSIYNQPESITII